MLSGRKMTGRNLRLIAAAAIALVVIFGGACWLVNQLVDRPPYFLEVSSENIGRSVLIEGIVVENNRGCEKNGECYLGLEVDGKEIRIIYDHGKDGLCPNEEAAARGKEIAEGDQVEVLGKITGDTEVTTCEFESYTIGIVR